MARASWIGGAMLLWPMIITVTVFCLAWIREAAWQRHLRVLPNSLGLVRFFLPGTLLGPALAGISFIAAVTAGKPGTHFLEAVMLCAWSLLFLFWPLGITAFVLGVVHKIYLLKVLARDGLPSPSAQSVRTLLRIAAMNIASVACELCWLLRPMNVKF